MTMYLRMGLIWMFRKLKPSPLEELVGGLESALALKSGTAVYT